jgi:hypothetical protein
MTYEQAISLAAVIEFVAVTIFVIAVHVWSALLVHAGEVDCDDC